MKKLWLPIFRSVVFVVVLSVAACASSRFKPLEFAPPVGLQDALPSQAIVYLLRAPHDLESLSVFINDTRVATMPPETYTALSLRPGNYAIRSAPSAVTSVPKQVEASILTVGEGERRFLYTAVPTRSSMWIDSVSLKHNVVPLFVLLRQPTGIRFWRECEEQDAQGLLSLAKPVLPEQGAL